MKHCIVKSVADAVKAARQLETPEALSFIENVAVALAETFRSGHKVVIAGNGGSLCDAMHFAEELTGFFREDRKALPALALSDPGHLTCVGNDSGFEDVFSRGVEAHCRKGDMLVVLTTSGNSENLIQAVKVAKSAGIKTVGFLGKTGGKLKGACDLEWIISGFAHSDRVQEAHMAAIHIIIEMVERQLFGVAVEKEIYASK